MVYPAVNGIELRKNGFCWILPKVCACWKAISPNHVNGECSEETRSRRPTRAIHHVFKATSETLFREFLIEL